MPFGVAVNSDTAEVYVTDLGSKWLSVIDEPTKTLQANVLIPEFPVATPVVVALVFAFALFALHGRRWKLAS